MRAMAVLIGVLFLGDAYGDDSAVKKEMAQLEGAWSMVSGEANGQSLPEESVKDGKRVAKDGVTTITIGGEVFAKAKFSIDPSKKPKAIEYSMMMGPTKGKTQLGFMNWMETRSSFALPLPERIVRPNSRPRRAADGP
jgi:uncharacterized protein (TIGR03067 family)